MSEFMVALFFFMHPFTICANQPLPPLIFILLSTFRHRRIAGIPPSCVTAFSSSAFYPDARGRAGRCHGLSDTPSFR